MTFANPEWLLGLILIPLFAVVAWWTWHKRGLRWRRLVAPRLQGRLSRVRPAWVHFTSLGMILAGWAGLVIAVAQPESGEEWIEVDHEGRNILFCIDISRSMLAEDTSPSRLLASRAAALEILGKFPTDRVGVLLFSGATLVQSPLTLDHAYVEQTLAQLTPDDIPLGGSNLAQAIETGTRLLAGTGQQTNIMVVFSDGEKSSDGLTDAAGSAAKAGIFIYALGMGTTDGTTIPDDREQDGRFRDRNGNVVFTRLDEQALKTLADETDGYYSRGMGSDFLGKLDRALAEMDRFQEEGKHQRVAKPAHRWFAVGGIFLLMGSLFIRSLPLQPVVAMLVCALSMPGAKAGPVEDGMAALANNQPQKAHQYFLTAANGSSGNRAARLHLSAGSAAAQAEDWELAMNSFSEALAADDAFIQQQAHYGLASALFYSGVPLEKDLKIKAWQGAVEHFEAALKIKPEHQPTIDNLAAVQKFLKDLSQPEPPPPSEEEKPKDPPAEDEDDNQEKESDPKEKSKKPPQETPDRNPEDPQKKEDNDLGEGDSNSEKEEGESPKQDPPKEPGEEPGESDPRTGDPSDQKDPDSNNETRPIDDPDAPENETPEDRARRLIRQYSDLGDKAPRRIRRPYTRSAQDW